MKTEPDKIDLQLLSLLQHDSTLSNKEIADKLGKTATPVMLRRKWLEENGYIRKYMAVVDREKLQLSLVAYTNVQLKDHSQQTLNEFEKAVQTFEEVMECNHMTGLYDYLLKIVVKDMNAYHRFVIRKLSTLPNIGTVQSSFVMSGIKEIWDYRVSEAAGKSGSEI